jgi:hypothetical protein
MKPRTYSEHIENNQSRVILALALLTLIILTGLSLPSGASAKTPEQQREASSAYPYDTGVILSTMAPAEPMFLLVRGGGGDGGGGHGRGRGRGRGRGGHGGSHHGSGRHGGFDDRGFDDHGSDDFIVDEFGNVIILDDDGGFDDHGIDVDDGFDDHGFHGFGHT